MLPTARTFIAVYATFRGDWRTWNVSSRTFMHSHIYLYYIHFIFGQVSLPTFYRQMQKRNLQALASVSVDPPEPIPLWFFSIFLLCTFLYPIDSRWRHFHLLDKKRRSNKKKNNSRGKRIKKRSIDRAWNFVRSHDCASVSILNIYFSVFVKILVGPTKGQLTGTLSTECASSPFSPGIDSS